MTMKSVRIGKDITFVWAVTKNGEALTSIENITVFAVHEQGDGYQLPITLKDGKIIAVFYGVSQQKIGKYRLTCWYNKGHIEESVVDEVPAVLLVRYSTEADDDLETVSIELDSSDLQFGAVKGDKGDAATINGHNAVTITGDVVTYDDNGTITIDAYNKAQVDEKIDALNQTISTAVANEENRAKEAEKANSDAIVSEANARTQADKELSEKIDKSIFDLADVYLKQSDAAEKYTTASAVSDTTEYSDISSILS